MLRVVTGCMFSGKSKELSRRIEIYLIARKRVCIFVHKHGANRKQRSLSGLLSKAVPEKCKIQIPRTIKVSSPREMIKLLRRKEKSGKKIDVVVIDEAQFFTKRQTKRFLEFLSEAERDRIVIVAGLDTDFLHRPFGVMPAALALADPGEILKLTAVCGKCGDTQASYTQRLIDGKPAGIDSPLVLIGSKDAYEPRCKKCFEIG